MEPKKKNIDRYATIKKWENSGLLDEPTKSLEYLFKLSIDDYISRLTDADKIYAYNKQFEYAIEERDYSLAKKGLACLIDRLMIDIKNKHCVH